MNRFTSNIYSYAAKGLNYEYSVTDTRVGINNPDSKVQGANMGLTWGRQAPGRPHVGPTNLAIWGVSIVFLAMQLLFYTLTSATVEVMVSIHIFMWMYIIAHLQPKFKPRWDHTHVEVRAFREIASKGLYGCS